MSIDPHGDTNFTAQVKVLLKKIYGRSPLQDSVLERAISYFDSQVLLEREKEALQESANSERIARFQHLQHICLEIINLSEASSIEETNRNSAQLLGTIQLLSPTEGKRVAIINEQHKPLYKAVLALRLLDNICINNKLSNIYIDSLLMGVSGDDYCNLASRDEIAYHRLVTQVKVPIVMAALLQDIGNYHPDAQAILQGEHGEKNAFRTLEVDERKALLQINYRETIKYLNQGIGVGNYIGHSKTDREHFNRAEQLKLTFIKQLLKSSIQPKQGIGNLLKVPQIYTSIVLSTKESYSYKLLPKVYQALYQNAERGIISKDIVDTLLLITGSFPQGYGITYIPHDIDENVRYEYAIVTQLYPEHVDEPLCRTATRNLTFLGHGKDVLVKKSHNLHFVATAQKFSKINKERLNEILELLSSNYQERKKLDLLPRCWQPSEYFTMKRHQKLWNRNS